MSDTLACDDSYDPAALAKLFAEDAVWDGGFMVHGERGDACVGMPETLAFQENIGFTADDLEESALSVRKDKE